MSTVPPSTGPRSGKGQPGPMAPQPPKVMLFDYGVGNLHSIQKALEQGGADVTVTTDGKELLTAQAIVLPGVGAFGACMEPLAEVRAALRARLEAGVPCLGVCIGMHLLYEASEETPGVAGIGLLPGTVRAFPRSVGKIPHMGWNEVQPLAHDGLLPETPMHDYFVHSYYVPPDDSTRATTTYGVPFASVVAKGNTYATQFHPEKSSAAGVSLVARWVERLPSLIIGGAA